jgi:hypothetical protein
MAEWFYDAYASVLKGTERASIEKMGAVVQLIEVLHLTGSKAKVHRDHDVLRVDIESAMGREFPSTLLGRTMRDLEDATGLRVRTTVTGGRGQGKVPAQAQDITR